MQCSVNSTVRVKTPMLNQRNNHITFFEVRTSVTDPQHHSCIGPMGANSFSNTNEKTHIKKEIRSKNSQDQSKKKLNTLKKKDKLPI